MTKNFLLTKEITESLFNRGFAVPVAAQEILSLSLSGGRLRHGEKRTIKIFLGGEPFDATLTSVDFDIKKNLTHKDMWQIVWSKNSPVAKKIREVFTAQKFFTLHATDMKDVFCLETNAACDELTLENLLDLSTLTDAQAQLVERFGLTKYRKVNREVGERLKREYRYRCQICGLDVGLFFGAQVCDCHHINYFSVSLDNAASNLLIVCPNHHRIIHAAQPTFDRERKLFRYPNGLEEVLRLNSHLL
ncbi:MAG: hypothetical protein IJ774_09740 [Selenomonadaceae bacterium]|nr:hypothetical protein [Selenomonadaceae bacterium]